MHQQTRQPEARRYCTSLGLLFYFSYSAIIALYIGLSFFDKDRADIRVTIISMICIMTVNHNITNTYQR